MAMIFVRILAVAVAAWWWSRLLNPRGTLHHRRSRVPLSQKSKLADAFAVTCGCLALFGIGPLVCAGMGFVCVALGLWFAKLDRAQYERQTGRFPSVPNDPLQMWFASFIINGAFLALFALFLVRDHVWPPVTEEQRLVHYVCWGFFALIALLLLLLWWDRPRRDTPER